MMKTAVAIVLFVVLNVVTVPPAGARGWTVDDVLRMESFGRTAITPDGGTLLFEQQPPYEEAPNTESVSGYARDESGLGYIYGFDIRRAGKPTLLFPAAPRTGYWMGGLSPDGRRLAVYSLHAGQVRAGVFDLLRRKLIWFDFTPNYYFLQRRPVWISNDELVYGALPDGEQPAAIVFAPQIIARMNRFWAKAMAGKEPSATVMTSTPDGIADAQRYVPGSLVRVDARTGKAERIGDGFFYGLRLSPSGRYLAALEAGGSIQRALDRPAVGLAERHQLVIFDLVARSAGVVPCPSCNVARLDYDWSADGARVLFFATDVGQELDAGRYYQYAPQSHQLQAIQIQGLAVGCADFMFPVRIVDIGNQLAVYARPAAADGSGRYFFGQAECEVGRRAPRYDWFLVDSDRAPVNLTASLEAVSPRISGKTRQAAFMLTGNRLWRLDGVNAPRNVLASTEVAGPLSDGCDALMMSRRTEAREFDYKETPCPIPSRFVTLENSDHLVNVDLDTGATTVLQKPEHAWMQAISLDRSAAQPEVAYVTPSKGGALRMTIDGGGKPGQLVATINSQLDTIELPRKIELTFEFDGRQRSTCVLLPSDMQPGKKYAAIVEVYPSASFASASKPCPFWPGYVKGQVSPWFSMDLMVEHGYVVISAPTAPPAVDPPQAEGKRAQIVLAALDRVLKEGYVDPERVGLAGFSQGNLSALGVLAETDRFRAAVVGYGISDVGGFYGQIPFYERMSFKDWGAGGWHNFSRFERPTPDWKGAKPWEDPAAYIANSPFYLADRINTPVLILHSDLDIFELSQSAEMFSALYRQRKAAEYVTYWGEGHNMNSPANLRDWWRRVFEWYDRYLKP
jgi:hypothetical protein